MKATLAVKEGSGSTVAAAAGHDHDAAGSTPGAHQITSDEMDAVVEKSIKAFPAKTAGVGGQDLAPRVLADGTRQFELTSSVVKWEVEPGRFVDAWTYNGAVPGPTIRVGRAKGSRWCCGTSSPSRPRSTSTA